jgi:hypothetical protein
VGPTEYHATRSQFQFSPSLTPCKLLIYLIIPVTSILQNCACHSAWVPCGLLARWGLQGAKWILCWIEQPRPRTGPGVVWEAVPLVQLYRRALVCRYAGIPLCSGKVWHGLRPYTGPTQRERPAGAITTVGCPRQGSKPGRRVTGLLAMLQGDNVTL